ncbi:MAG: hypothetical protein QM691_02395 [Opitutaceae bacterium]
MKTLLLACFAALLGVPLCAAPTTGTIAPDLAGMPSERGWKLVNRSAQSIEKDGAPAVRLEGSGDHGYARIESLVFGDGTIEFDARGKNVVQESFLGVAFHGADWKTYDAVYFRPFNFRAADPIRRQHAVQYISLPAHTWQRLRSEHPGRYEKPVVLAPDPDAWFHVRIVVAAPKVSVFVDGAADPSLQVDQLSDRRHGWIAIWTDVNGGDFANLRITPAP